MNIENYKPTSEVTKEILRENNFKYIEGVYSYKFPVYKYKKEPILWCSLYIDIDNNSCNLSVTNLNNNIYVPYFNREYGGKNMVVESIDKKINTQLRVLIKAGIIKKRGKK